MRYLLLLSLLLAQPVLAEQPYRCVNSAGITTFQDQPCNTLQDPPANRLQISKLTHNTQAVTAQACQHTVSRQLETTERARTITFTDTRHVENSVEGSGTLMQDNSRYQFTYSCQIGSDGTISLSYAVDH